MHIFLELNKKILAKYIDYKILIKIEIIINKIIKLFKTNQKFINI